MILNYNIKHYTKSKDQDMEIVTGLLDGFLLKIRARSEYVVNEYSLNSLARIYRRIKKLCKK